LGAKLCGKPCTKAQNKAKRTNQIDFSFSLCKQEVASSIPATSTNPFDCKGLTELVPHTILAAAHEVCKIALIVATVHNHSETNIAENTERLCQIGIAGNGGPMLKKHVRSSCQEFQVFRPARPIPKTNLQR
jgi:hypothetical protein